MHTAFQPLLGRIRIKALEFQHFLTPIKSPHCLCWAYQGLCGNSFPCSRLSMPSFVLLKCLSYDPWLTPQPYLYPMGRGWDSLFCGIERVCASPVSAAKRDPLASGDLHLLLKLILLCLFSVWVGCCSIQHLTVLRFPWWLRYQEAVGGSVGFLLPVIGNWCYFPTYTIPIWW